MSYSTLQAPIDIFGLNSALRSRTFTLNGDHRRDDDSHSPMSEPRSPLFRPSLTAEMPHLASLYNSPYAAAAVAAAVAGQGAGAVGAPSTFGPYGRPPGATGFYPGLINADGWRRSQYLSQLDFCWPHGFRSLETVVGPRTKAPREATSILKAWLNEHKDNPYPTKSEKMTLSIVTHMTLTQVSTWFANARRRIKKENKMTWTAKTRCGERDGSSSNDDESEKDFFGRGRSPFSSARKIGKDEDRRSSGEYEDVKSSQKRIGGNVRTSSRHFDMEQKGSSHPLFTAFPGLHPPYFNTAAAASLQDALRQQMLSKQSERVTRDLNSDEALASSSSTNHYSTEKQAEHPSPPQLLKRACHRDELSPIAPQHSQYDSTHAETQQPFVQIQRRSSVDTKKTQEETPASTNALSLNEDNLPMSCTVFSKSGADDAERPFPLPRPDKTEQLKEESDATNSEDEPHSGNKPIVPPLYRPLYMAGDVMSTENGKMDALSCWIREFQQLVASGQELKAKQALATVLAVAAKAGAYNGMGSNKSESYYLPPRLSSPEGRLSSEGSPVDTTRHQDRRSPITIKRSYRFSPMSPARFERVSRADDAFTFSSELRNRRSLSPITPPGSGVRLRSPCHGSNTSFGDTPMNLTKSSTGQDWKHGNLAADDARIEA